MSLPHDNRRTSRVEWDRRGYISPIRHQQTLSFFLCRRRRRRRGRRRRRCRHARAHCLPPSLPLSPSLARLRTATMRDGGATDGESGGAISKTQCRVVVSKMGRRGGVTQWCAGNSVTRQKRLLPLTRSLYDHMHKMLFRGTVKRQRYTSDEERRARQEAKRRL